MRLKGWLIFMIGCAGAVMFSCEEAPKNVDVSVDYMHSSMQNLTDVIVHDIFSPPVAARIYAYPSIGAYEIMAATDSSYRSLAGQLNDLTSIPQPEGEVDPEIAAVHAFNLLGKKYIFSEDRVMAFHDSIMTDIRKLGVDEEVYTNSVNWGDAVAAHIAEWSNLDNYSESRSFMKHTVSSDPDSWQPTPPAYMEAIEPHWSSIRTFAIDSADQFTPERPTAFNVDPESQFYKEVMEVYETGKSLDEEQSEIASFWDCNPYVMNVHGHVMFATKKITPGGHWMGIAKIAAQLDNADFAKTVYTYALTAIALSDGFISCWDEKYRSNLIRPETVINRYIDEEWTPLLQTPPFPEYTSGHSVISGAAGEALTSIYGENFAFVDSTEAKYGLPIRSFESFRDASSEAAISRLYGGIHYRPAIDNGITQGRALGNYIVDKLQFREE